MIVFKFELNGLIKDYLIQKQKKGMLLSAFITSMVFFVPAVIIGIVWHRNTVGLIISVGLAVFSVLFFIIFSRWDSPLNGFFKSVPESILIDIKEGVIESNGDNQYSYKRVKLSEIKEIVDYENWYKINFYFPNKSMFFICQKDLIVQGTIEQFEAIFKNKIVQQYK